MSKLQILVATMHQTDMCLAERMNISCDAIIANQADVENIAEEAKPFGNIKMITTRTRGVGLNRNIALMASDAELVLFADDDLVYYDGVPAAVVSAFADMPQADVIVFGVDIFANGQLLEKRHLPIKRRRLWNSMKFGTYAIAVRKQAVLKNGLVFSQLFGGGCLYGSGEDTLFIRHCFRNRLKVYSHSLVLGRRYKDTSSWFSGYNEKFFFDKGALFGQAFPICKYPVILYMALRMKKRTELPLGTIIALMLRGCSAGKTLTPYCAQRNEPEICHE